MERAEQLKWTLDSIAAQHGTPLTALHMSWSSASASIAEVVRQALADVALPLVVAIEQPERRSQFEHLRELARRAATTNDAPPAWVFFSDDDDIWSETRHTLFMCACADAAACTRALVCTRKTRPAAAGISGDTHEALPAPLARDAPTVRALLKSGELRFTDLKDFDDARVSSFDMDEYFDHAVRFEALTAFFAHAPNALVRHKLCDLAFVHWLKKGAGRVAFDPNAVGHHDDFVYYYTRPENAPYADGFALNGASTGVDIGESEIALAREGQPLVDAALRDVPTELQMPPDRLGFFLSCLRQAIEQELVQLRVASACPRSAVTDDVCARHVDLLLENHPMADSKGLATFREWAVRTARGPILRGLLKLLSFDLPRRRA